MGKIHKAKWFEEIVVDEKTQEKEFLYKGGYWEARD